MIYGHEGKSSEKRELTSPCFTYAGPQAIVGSLIPPSKVVCLPQRNGPLLPSPAKAVRTKKENFSYVNDNTD